MAAIPSAWPIAGGHVAVALVIGTLGRAGAVRHVLDLVRAFGTGRHRVRVYALAGASEPAVARLRALDVPVTVLPRRYPYEPARIVALARAFKRDGIDVVHAILPAGAAYGALAARLAGVPTVVVASRAGDAREQRSVRPLLHRIYRHAAAVLANTWAQARRLAADADLPLERVQVVYDGVDLARHPAPRMLDGLRERVWHRPLVIGGAGSRETGRALFFATAERIVVRHPDAHFVWLQEEVEGAVPSDGARYAVPAGVSMTFVPLGDDPDPVLHQLAMLCVTGDAEDPAVDVIPAAMAAGRPIVALEAPGVDEVVTHGTTGVVVTRSEPAALADAALALLEDRPRLRGVGHAARSHAERALGADAMARATAAVYEDALLGRTTPVEPSGVRAAAGVGEELRR